MFKKASKLTGDLGTNYCYLLECRTITLVYRSNFLANIFNCMMFVKRKRLFINQKPINYINAVVPIGTSIIPAKVWVPWIRYHLYKRLSLRSVLYNTPKFLFISFRFWIAFLIKKPKRKDLIYVGGYNELFVGWGGDDNEIRNRLKYNGFRQIILNKVKLIHINLVPRNMANKIRMYGKKQFNKQLKLINNIIKVDFNKNGLDFKYVLIDKTKWNSENHEFQPIFKLKNYESVLNGY